MKARRERETDEQRQKRLEYMKNAYANETPEQRHESLARRRQDYAASPELRESLAEGRRGTKRKPHVREKLKEYYRELRQKERLLGKNPRRQLRHPDLMTRRANSLRKVICQRRSTQEWAWKSHTPVLDKDRIDHTCTACGNIRFLKLWWKEKPLGKAAADATLDQDRYICHNCFANNFELMVPESYLGKLPRLFTSPDHPPPYKSQRPRAEVSANKVKKEHEEDHESRHQEDQKEGRA
jgi:hypothetical protein